MLRIESYVTSIILSYVDRYIKNFRLQDAKVSLWSGDGVFHNLDLDLEVLEQELNLPFSFVSGHINELLIHVPWTRLNSEPVRITINTIECVIKLRSPGSHKTVPLERIKRQLSQRSDENIPPPTYMSNLVNKIMCNLSVTCNNFILKYVEEDIVFSMNIKTLNLESVNSSWEPEFLELTPTKLILRKLVSLSDITICLDKRNASGRIESYMEPLLYRCFLTMRLTRTYPSVNASKASLTRVDVFCEKMSFTLSEPQVPMLMRMFALALALQKKQLTPKTSAPSIPDKIQELGVEEIFAGEFGSDSVSWSTWVWSWVPTVPFLVGEDDSIPDPVASHTLQFGFYIENLSLSLKLCNMMVDLQGCLMELESHDTSWTNVRMGISQLNVVPSGDCCCGTSEQNQLPYLSCGSAQNSFLSGSLFGNTDIRRVQERSWDYHIATVSEAILLEKTPAFAVDYLFCLENTHVTELEDDDDDQPRRPPIEKVLIRHVADGIVVRICSGLIHRTQMILKSASTYDYVPYTTQYPQPEKTLDALQEIDDNMYIAQYMSRYTLFHPRFEFYPANHSPVQPSFLGRKLSRSQKRAQQAASTLLPSASIVIEWNCLDAKLTRPLNPDKVQMLSTSCSISPEFILETETRLSLKIVGICSSMSLPNVEPRKILEIPSFSLDWNSQKLVVLPPPCVLTKIEGNIDQLMLIVSKPKLLLLIEIFKSLVMSNNKQKYQASYDTIFNTSLIQDATATYALVYLKLNFNQASFEWVQTKISESMQMSIKTSQAFVSQLGEKSIPQQTMILNAPEYNCNDKYFLTALFQRPLGDHLQSHYFQTQIRHGPVFTFCLNGIRISFDHLLYTWLLYLPIPIVRINSSGRSITQQVSHINTGSTKSRKISESSGSAPKRAPTPQESVHSSSELETTPSLQVSSQQPIAEFVKTDTSHPTFVERLTTLYPIWQSTVIFGEISDFSVYFPNATLCSPLPQPMESSLQSVLKNTSQQLQVVVFKLPSLMLLCSSLKQAPFELPLSVLPVVLPSNIWTPDKCNFPWSLKVSELGCFTLDGLSKLELLKPLSATCTVGISTKSSGSLLTSLALCLHLDTTAISISICQEQVSLLANLVLILAQVLQVLMPVRGVESQPSEELLLSSPEVPLESEDSLSTSQTAEENREGSFQGVVKLTGWMQWTLARFTLNIYNPSSKSCPDCLKLTLDVEDIFFSLDIERVYHKLKLKVSTATIQHYCRKSINQPWILGPFQGLVMCGHDPDGILSASGLPNNDDTTNTSGFLTATLTRACCSNLHSKIGTPANTSKLLKKSGTENKFVTEIAVKLQPLDIVLSPNTIGAILNVLNPLLKMPVSRSPPRPVLYPPKNPPLTYFSSSSLPLLYLDLLAVRIVLPVDNSYSKHDVIVIQFDGVNANPQPENPVCRVPYRLDIYQAAEKHRLLGVPGSEVEDRQYQVDIVALTVKTGIWDELKSMLLKDAVPSLQNPALDWNEGRRHSSTPPALENMLAVIPAFNLCIVFAPAIIYHEKTVVCGHSIEINALSEIIISLSTEQIELFGVLANEISNVLPSKSEMNKFNELNIPFLLNQSALPRVSLNFESIDSGLESFTGSTQLINKKAGGSDIHSGSIGSVNENKGSSPAPSIQPTSGSFSTFSKRSANKESYVPLEVLITGSAVTGILSKTVESNKSEVLPLLYLRTTQPHVYLSKLGETKTCQASAYDFLVRCGKTVHFDPKFIVAQNQIKSEHFVQSLFETRSGDPHPTTGIPPALLTLKINKTASKPIKLEADIGRPIRITIRVDILKFLNQALVEIKDHWIISKAEFSDINETSKTELNQVRNSTTNNEKMWSQLKSNFSYFNSISLCTQKILVAILTVEDDTGNIGVSVDKVILQSGISQHAINNQIFLQGFVVSSQLNDQTKLFVNPWILSLKATFLWESWSVSPLIQISTNSEVLSINISPKHILCLQQVFSEYSNYLCSEPASENLSAHISTNKLLISNSPNGVEESEQHEQHYKEDLQAGAFQFVDGNADLEDLPLVYQVVFSAGVRHHPTMAWRYPQPRAITRLHIQPLPFRDSQPGDTINCVLQYWSDTHNSYKEYINFTLCESAACTVALPASSAMPIVSPIWRVVLGVGSIQQPLPVNVKALAACLRVDSYFCPSLIPKVQTAVTFSILNMTLWTEVNKVRPMPAEFRRYKPDTFLPLNHCFLTLSLNQSDLTFTSWAQGNQLVTLDGTLRLDILNYRTLNMHCLVDPFKLVSSLHINPDSSKSLNLVSERIVCHAGPSACHTLSTAAQLWNQYNSNIPQHFIIFTPYIICNNSCLPIRFGQWRTDEMITLECLQCHLYSWYSIKQPLALRFSLTSRNQWSKPVYLLKEGCITVVVCDEESRDWNIIITVKSVTNFIYEISIAGQLIIKSSLDVDVEVLISNERQNRLIIPPLSAPPGIILSPHFLPSLRIRFPNISTTWSGIISLKGDGLSHTKQWIVKIPLREKSEFRCLWCHIVWDIKHNSERILVVLSSMYRVMSQLPCAASVLLETPSLNVKQNYSINGRGVIQDLDCLGTPDVSHKLTFQLEDRVLSSSPEVPLSYSMLENQNNVASPSVDINILIEHALDKSKIISWPYTSSILNSCSWTSAPQPDTIIFVKVVHGKEWIKPSNVQINLQPWALLMNSLGCHISLQSNEGIICSLPHMSVLAPPPLESTFQLGLYIGSSLYLSGPLQLSCDKAFYMPHIAGLVPLKGHINTSISCGSLISYVNIMSNEENNIRLLHVRSSFVIANFSSRTLKIAPLAVAEINNREAKYTSLPSNIEYHTFTLRPQKPSAYRGTALPITDWFNMSNNEEKLIPYLAVSSGGDFSCPVPVQQSSDRHRIAVIVPNEDPLDRHVNFMLLLCSEQKDGQVYLTLWDQLYPPIVVHNRTQLPILFAKSFSEKGGDAIPYSSDWDWQLNLNADCSSDYHLPGESENSTDKGVPSNEVAIAVIALKHRPNPCSGYRWSEGISLSPCRGRLVALPGTTGVNVAVAKIGFILHVTLSHSSQSEISPLDVRSRLSREALLYSNEDEIKQDGFDFKLEVKNKMSKDSDNNYLVVEEKNQEKGSSKPGLEDVTCFVQGITVIFSVESDSACDCREIAAFVIDDVSFTVQPTNHPDFDTKELLVRLTLGDFQLDNQEYTRGGYDFPVVLMTQMNETSEPQPVEFSVNGSPLTLIEMSRLKGSALDLVTTLDVSSNNIPDIQDSSLTLTPLQIYIEDTYILELKDHLLRSIPAYTLTDYKNNKSNKLLDTLIDSFDLESSNDIGHNTVVNEDEQKGVLFFNLKQNLSDEILEDKEEELFNVSEPDNDIIQGIGFIPENRNTNETEHRVEEKTKDNPLLDSHMATWTYSDVYINNEDIVNCDEYINEIPIPKEIIASAQELACPLRLRSLFISPLVVNVSLHTSTTFYIGLDNSPLNFSAFQRANLVTTAYRLGHALTLHYFLGAVYGSAWALVSLEMLGSPGGLARTVGTGLWDFVSLPYQGIQQGPRAFLTGIAHGSASLMRHITAGTLTSVTKLAASWARTLDRLTLNQDDLRLTEEARRLRPQGLTQGLMHGLTEFGVSLLGAMGSLVHGPLQYAVSTNPNHSFVNSVGRGVMGVFTRPLSGAAEFVALTGEGLLSGAGWSSLPKARSQPRAQHNQCGTESMLKFCWKVLQNSEQLLLAMEASSCNNYEPVILLLTKTQLIIVLMDKLSSTRTINLADLRISAHPSDPTLVVLKILPLETEAEALARTRLAQFVRDSQRIVTGEQDTMSQSSSVDTNIETEPPLSFYVNPELRNYFIAFITYARRFVIGRDFPLVS